MRPRSVSSALALASSALALAALLSGATACSSTKYTLMDSAIASGAHHPPVMPAGQKGEGAEDSYLLLAGDLHCHVSPPDSPFHVIRGFDDTVRLAEKEGLDFVVLTPHVRARFFQDASMRQRALAGNRLLRDAIAHAPPGRTLFFPGFEYTDSRYGHAGGGLGDLEATLAEVSVEDAQVHPARFFERYLANGGVLVVNHPLTTPVRSVLASVVPIAGADLSWRPFTAQGPFPEEIDFLHHHAQTFEAFNLSTTELRDRYLLGDREATLRTLLARLDRESVLQGRAIAPVGGSDSHSFHLRATTFVLARERSEAAIREAIVSGRTCVRNPVACGFQARAPGGEWVPVGGRLRGVSAVDVRAPGDGVEVFRDGELVATPARLDVARVATPEDRCSVLRVRVEAGFSAPIYANCAF